MIIKRVGCMGKINTTNKSIKKNIDKTNKTNVESVENIIVVSAFAYVHLIASDGNELVSHLYGKTNKTEDLALSVKTIDKDIVIAIITTEGACYDAKLKLDILVPKKLFNSIVVKTNSADIVIGREISSTSLDVKSESGDVSIFSTFLKSNINTISGDLDVIVKAKNDIILEAGSASGDISVSLSGIGKVQASARTVSGEVENTYTATNGFVANLDISTISGDIAII